MKRFLVPLFIFSLCQLSIQLNAQTATFTVASDTVYFNCVNSNSSSPIISSDLITNTASTSGMVIKWHVYATNFTDTCLAGNDFGICDNRNCYYNSNDSELWNIVDSRTGMSFNSANYGLDTPGAFELDAIWPAGVPSGCYYVTVNLMDVNTGYSKLITFDVCNTTTKVSNVNNAVDNVVVYPNPATKDLNVVFDANSDIKNIAIYNIIGKVVKVVNVSGNMAILDISNLPTGIYIARLLNSTGNSVAIRKFTKQ